ncbi:MAG: Na+/H+ antiporter NhaC family protein [Anaerovoracaceae bacterium]
MHGIAKYIRSMLAVLVVSVVIVFGITACAPAEAGTDYGSTMVGTFWALVPPLVAIILALITKEVHSSLFAGIVVGALFYTQFDLLGTVDVVFNDGFLGSLSDAGNVGIIIFLAILGIMVALINATGATKAYGDWARAKLKTRNQSILATFALGVLIFVDDYFNCLTVGSVMRPVTDTHNVSRAKLAYIIDATAAPICMIAPISSWAAAVSGFVEGYNGIDLFIRAIPFNFYSLMTIVMLIGLTVMKFDYGPMRIHERNAILHNDLYTTADRPYASLDVEEADAEGRGKVIDLLLPIVVLIVCCVTGMIYTGGFFDGASFIDAFADCDATYGLPLGAAIAMIFTIIYYMCRRLLTFSDAMNCIPEGTKAMIPAILILTFAWTLCSITGMLEADVFVAGVMENAAGSLKLMLPAIIFVVASFLGFSTGTSWGTFGILIPIVVNLFSAGDPMLVIGISACCAGGVCGDHCSPISDTTIMASTGAQCNHINHVSTQLPYALTVLAVSFVGYLIAGITKSAVISLPLTFAIMVILLFCIRAVVKKNDFMPDESSLIESKE